MDFSDPPDRARIVEMVRALLPRPLNRFISSAEREQAETDGVTTLLGGFPQEVVVRISERIVTVGVFTAQWFEPHCPTMVPKKIVSFRWRRIPLQVLEPMVRQAVETARQIRQSRFRRCELCGEMNPPEAMHDQTTCHACAQNHLGVIY